MAYDRHHAYWFVKHSFLQPQARGLEGFLDTFQSFARGKAWFPPHKIWVARNPPTCMWFWWKAKAWGCLTKWWFLSISCSRVDFLCCFKLWWGSDGLLLHWRTSEQSARAKIGRVLSCFGLRQVEHDKADLQQSLEICCGISRDVLKSDADCSYWKIQCEDGIHWFQAMATPNIWFAWAFWIHSLPCGLSMK